MSRELEGGWFSGKVKKSCFDRNFRLEPGQKSNHVSCRPEIEPHVTGMAHALCEFPVVAATGGY